MQLPPTILRLPNSKNRTRNCFKKDFANPTDFAIIQDHSELSFNENCSHTYFYSHPQNCHLLQVPKPFRIGTDWPTKLYQPALSTTTDPLKIQLFFTLAEPKLAKDSIRPYLLPPDRWDNSNHPLFSEPSEND